MTRVVLIALLLLAAVDVRCQQQICLNNCGTSTKAYQACIDNSANAELAKECGVMRPAVTVPQTPKCQPAGDGCNTVCCLGNACTETLLACEAPKPEPLDVPAIQDSRELSLSCREAILNQPLLSSENLHCVCTNTKESCTVLKWDCDDKTRFLLPSADGKYHCLKLVPEVKP